MPVPLLTPGWFESGSLSFAIAANMVGAAASIAVAFLAWTIGRAQRDIAKQQKDIAAAKLNLDMFDRRFEFFVLAQNALGSIVERSGASSTALRDLGALRSKGAFLFGADMRDFVDTIMRRAFELRALDEIMATSEMGVPDGVAAKRTEIIMWCVQELDKLESRFGVYLDFGRWR